MGRRRPAVRGAAAASVPGVGPVALRRRISPAVFCAISLVSTAVLAQVEQLQSVQSASGRSTTNGALTAVSAGGQFTAGFNESPDGRFVNRSGFLAGVLMSPLLDTDGDGLCDEMDLDNDGDLAADRDELIADTDSTNSTSVLAVVAVERLPEGVRVEWTGGARARQVLIRRDGMAAGDWTPLATNLPPTFAVTSYIDRTPLGRTGVYRVVADRPENGSE